MKSATRETIWAVLFMLSAFAYAEARGAMFAESGQPDATAAAIYWVLAIFLIWKILRRRPSKMETTTKEHRR